MSVDKRTVSTDALETLGTIIDEHQKRDAIHLAVIPAIAGEFLWRGADVGFSADGKAYIKMPTLVGIVDPFLETSLEPGERFWLVIYPRKITSLRHVWTHPDIPEDIVSASPVSADKAYSEQWLRDYCLRDGVPPYERLIAEALDSDGSEYLRFGTEAYGEIPPEFWDHVEVVTGQKIENENRASYFSCAC